MSNIANIILVKALNEMMFKYNNKEEGINYTDVRDLHHYIETTKGIDITATNKIIYN